MRKFLLVTGGTSIAIATLALTMLRAEAPAEAVRSLKAVTASAYPERPLFGDTHLHTTNSFDAFGAGNRLSPDESLRFARGEQVTSSSGIPAKLSRPLDFLVIADHSDAIGVTTDLYNTAEADLADPVLKRWRNMLRGDRKEAHLVTREIIAAFNSGNIPQDMIRPDRVAAMTRRIWDAQIDSVERYNEPGSFTALHGFEYSLSIKGSSLHRNVIFRDGADKARSVLPFPSRGATGPEPLWDFMEGYEKASGGQLLSIPHNPNLSNGLYFAMTGPDGEPMTAEQARRRATREPVVEVTQYKGDSESHPTLSRNDEFADYGDAGWENGNGPLSQLKKPEMFGGEYAREALKRGLLIEALTGVNPYAFGMIGSTDTHTGLSTADEDNFFGKYSNDEPNSERITAVINPGIAESRIGHQYLAGGLAAVWATANTREAIFDALMRREVYATTGPRMSVRMFGGWNFVTSIFDGDWLKTAYDKGVPMGGNLSRGKGVPTFIVQALKDPMGANLDRVQIVKGWVNAKGVTQEKIYDVVWSAPKQRMLFKGKLTPVGDTVDLAKASYTNSIGAPELRTVWRDPDFKKGQKAFYYARVLEIPTPRWTAYDAVRFKVKPPAGAKLKDQERAYTSPIWVGS